MPALDKLIACPLLEAAAAVPVTSRRILSTDNGSEEVTGWCLPALGLTCVCEQRSCKRDYSMSMFPVPIKARLHNGCNLLSDGRIIIKVQQSVRLQKA